MRRQHADATDIPRIAGVRRRHGSDKCDGCCLVKRQPPMAQVEWWNRSTVEEGQAMQFCQRIGDVIVLPVDLANPI
jgi:hypothetical protein